MTESQWLTVRARPARMFDLVAGRLSRRQLYLIGVTTYRADRWYSPASPWVDVLDCLERYAEGHAGEAEFLAARGRVERERAAVGRLAVWDDLAQLFALDIREATRRVVASHGGGRSKDYILVRAALCDLLREIAGNPFRPWQAIPEAMGGGLVQPDGATVRVSDAARQIAAGVAAEQAFDRLPVLADALEDGGLTDAELLAHCRRPGGHLRGCWAVDVVLGRA